MEKTAEEMELENTLYYMTTNIAELRDLAIELFPEYTKDLPELIHSPDLALKAIGTFLKDIKAGKVVIDKD